MDKKTDELMQILHNRPNADTYLKENENELLHQSLTELLQEYLTAKNLKKADVIRDSNLIKVSCYQIFDGKMRSPGRDKLLCLAFGLHLTVDETQHLLKVARVAPLYPRVMRDILILECLFQGKDIFFCNDSLYAHHLDILE